MKLNRRFKEFLRDEVNLNQTRITRLQRSVRDVNSYLVENLTGYQRIDRQGSYALDTLIRPVTQNGEYDADIQVVMNPNGQSRPQDYLDALADCLSGNANFRDKITMGPRCVTLEYAGDFHLDVVPRITREGQHYICNGTSDRFEETDGTGYRDWFLRKSNITKVNLKRAVRLLKYLREREDNYIAKSIMLTTLAANTIQAGDRGQDSVKSVASTLTTVLTRMDSYLQGQPRKPAVRNPVLRSETFDRHWDDVQFEILKQSINRYAEIASDALACPTIPDSIVRWRRLFGSGFGRHYKGTL